MEEITFLIFKQKKMMMIKKKLVQMKRFKMILRIIKGIKIVIYKENINFMLINYLNIIKMYQKVRRRRKRKKKDQKMMMKWI